MTDPTPDEGWKTQLWAELDSMSDEQQFVTSGEWIAWITRELLPDLGERRRDKIMDFVDKQKWETAQIAEHFGMRRSTVIRLLDEGRHARKQAGKTDTNEVP